jgi:hypothetical protein
MHTRGCGLEATTLMVVRSNDWIYLTVTNKCDLTVKMKYLLVKGAMDRLLKFSYLRKLFVN